ncbi:hypothetical protein [Parasphingorhabdus sp.]
MKEDNQNAWRDIERQRKIQGQLDYKKERRLEQRYYAALKALS